MKGRRIKIKRWKDDTLPLQLGYEAAQRAADHAGPVWKEAAYAAFVAFARTHDSFTTEDVRFANPQIPPPPDERAWGYPASRARDEGIVSNISLTRARSRRCHGRLINVWTIT